MPVVLMAFWAVKTLKTMVKYAGETTSYLYSFTGY
jgi:hypothetical protein